MLLWILGGWQNAEQQVNEGGKSLPNAELKPNTLLVSEVLYQQLTGPTVQPITTLLPLLTSRHQLNILSVLASTCTYQHQPRGLFKLGTIKVN